MSLDAQLAHAKALLENAERLKTLAAKRDQLTADLEAVNAELSALIGNGEPERTRAPQKCKVCGSTEHNARFHKEK